MTLVFVSGIRGFLGQAVARRARADGFRVCGVDWSRTPADIEGDVDEVRSSAVTTGSLTSMIEEHGAPDVFVHAAGSGLVGASWADPLNDFECNVATTACALDVLQRLAPEAVFVLPSSAAVYGNAGRVPIAEHCPTVPISPYGNHKLMAEELCRQATGMFGLRTVAIRFFSLFGPGLKKQLLWDIATRLSRTPGELVLSGAPQASRDFLFIDDAVGLIFKAASYCPPQGCLVNGGTGVGTTIETLAQMLIDRLAPGTALSFDGEVRHGDPVHLVADTGKTAAFGFTPACSLPEGVDQYVSWFNEQTQHPRSEIRR